MLKSRNSFILKSLYAIMVAPVQPKQSLPQLAKTAFFPHQSNYNRVSSVVNIASFFIPNISAILSRRIAKSNNFPWKSNQPANLIAHGSSAAVFKINGNVLRIYRKSFGGDPRSVRATVSLYQKHYRTINSWYENKHNLILPMQFLILNGPPLSQPTAASLQPYLPISRNDLFKDFTNNQLLKLFRAHPSFKQAFLFFTEKTLRICEQENSCPDLLGENNIIINYQDGVPHLHIIDIGILNLDEVKEKSPNRILQIQAALQNLELIYKDAKNFNKIFSTKDIPATSTLTLQNDSSKFSTVNSFTRHLENHAIKYYPELDPLTIKVRLTKTKNRLNARLYYFNVSDQSHTKPILIKHSLLNSQEDNSTRLHKPRLYPATPLSDMPFLEYQALKIIQAHFLNLDPDCINTVKVLDFLSDKRTIVMEQVQLPNLRSRYLEDARRLPKKIKLPIIRSFRNAGKWLRIFHNIPTKGNLKNRHTHLKDFTQAILILTDYLTRITHHKIYFERITSDIVNMAKCHLIEDFPLGLGHGDFAPRNILVNKQGTVTILDTFANWKIPIYEDIGYFLNSIYTSRYQVLTLGLVYSSQRVVAYEKAFLHGYFHNVAIPIPQIKLFEILAVLDKLADTLDRIKAEAHSKIINLLILKLFTRHYRKRLNRTLKEIHDFSPTNNKHINR